MIEYGKVDLTPLWTHRMRLDDIAEAYAVFQERRNGALKIALTPCRAARAQEDSHEPTHRRTAHGYS